jgi:hypothetical protein
VSRPPIDTMIDGVRQALDKELKLREAHHLGRRSNACRSCHALSLKVKDISADVDGLK